MFVRYVLFIVNILWNLSNAAPVFASSEDRFVETFAVGLSQPAVGLGVSGGVPLSRQFFTGASLFGQSRSVKQESTWAKALGASGFLEFRKTFYEGYHRLWFRLGLGVASLGRSEWNTLRRYDSIQYSWSGYASQGLGMDWPILDLLWLRTGLFTEQFLRYPDERRFGIQIGFVAGAPWLGWFGDSD